MSKIKIFIYGLLDGLLRWSVIDEKKPWNELVKTLLQAIFLAVIFRSLFFEPFHIPSGSMKDGLLVGDFIFVSKTSYGYSRYSFPLGLPFFEGRVFADEPKRGDVVVFRLPSNPRVDYIKRLVGLPGDKIQVRDGVLYINDKAAPQTEIEPFIDDEKNHHQQSIRRFKETLPDENMKSGKIHTVLDATHNSISDDTEIHTVPKGHYFMMGDNRDNSTDSRFGEDTGFIHVNGGGGVGFVPAENLVGRADFILLSIGENDHFWEVWRWFDGGLRWNRFFTKIN